MTPRPDFAQLLVGAALCASPALASLAQETYRVEASDGASFDFYSYALDADGPWAVVGADGHNNGLSEGAAYVMDWATGAELYELLPSNPTGGMLFGWAVAVQGSMALISAPGEGSLSFSGGKAYLYDLATGAELWNVVASAQSSGQRFGHSIAVDGDYALIGAPGDESRTGAGFLFDLATGTELAKWVPSDATQNGTDGYGYKVAIDGNYGALAQPGSVAVFDVVTGAELYRITRPGFFGVDMDAEDGLLIVGAINDATLGSGAGAAYVFDLATGAEVAKLLAYDGGPGAALGVGVAISDSHLVASAYETSVNGTDSGSAYVYDRATFQQVARLLPSDGQPSDWFGRSVAIDGTTPFVGAMRTGTFRGAAYRFDIEGLSPGSPSCFGLSCPCGTDDPLGGCPNATGSGAVLGASGSASTSADDLILTTTMLPANQFGIYFMGDQHEQATPIGNGLRCASGSLLRYQVQNTGPGTADLGPGVVSTACASFPAVGCIAAGSSWTFQFWYRDGGSSCSATSNTSSALTVLFTP